MLSDLALGLPPTAWSPAVPTGLHVPAPAVRSHQHPWERELPLPGALSSLVSTADEPSPELISRLRAN